MKSRHVDNCTVDVKFIGCVFIRNCERYRTVLCFRYHSHAKLKEISSGKCDDESPTQLSVLSVLPLCTHLFHISQSLVTRNMLNLSPVYIRGEDTRLQSSGAGGPWTHLTSSTHFMATSGHYCVWSCGPVLQRHGASSTAGYLPHGGCYWKGKHYTAMIF